MSDIFFYKKPLVIHNRKLIHPLIVKIVYTNEFYFRRYSIRLS